MKKKEKEKNCEEEMRKEEGMKSGGNLQLGEEHPHREELLQGLKKDRTLDKVQDLLLLKDFPQQEGPLKDHQLENNRLQGDTLLEGNHHLLEEYHHLEDSHLQEDHQQIPAAVHQPTGLECQPWPAWAQRSRSQPDLDQEVGRQENLWPRKGMSTSSVLSLHVFR